MSGIRVTATDLAHPEHVGTVDVMDNYVLIAAGSCEMAHRQVHYKADGTQTHVITVTGCRPVTRPGPNTHTDDGSGE